VALNQPDHLLVTNKEDITSDFLVREMRKRELSFWRFNTETLPMCDVTTQSSGFCIKIDNQRIVTSELKSAYFRRPGAIEIRGSSSLDIRQYRTVEWIYLLRSIYLAIGDRWFSHPNSILIAENKPGQLAAAKEVGLMVPDYVVTNSTMGLIELFDGGAVIAKPLSQNLLEANDPGSVIFTNEIESLEQVDPLRLSKAPVIFQRKVEKAFDVRVTVVGDRVFAVRIDSQKNDNSRIDWRAGGSDLLKHDLFSLPNEIEKQCIHLVTKMGLNFGAIDLVEDPDGEFWCERRCKTRPL